jgi:molybdopterin synthase catalytic subunit
MIRVETEDFDIGAEITKLSAGRADIGAVVTFTGLVRDMADAPLAEMTLEHYPGMTQKSLMAIEAEARSRWPLQDCLIIHRYGSFKPGDRIVLVITASAHRDAAFEAARFLMDWLKTEAPFWKQEKRAGGATWVEAKASDTASAEKWQKKGP